MDDKIGVYLGACRAWHPNFNLDYNDIVPGHHINLVCDMLDVDLDKYDYIIASPPCNFYSRANYRRFSSEYALRTRHLLPDILLKCCELNKPFIIENVRNYNMFVKCGIIDFCNKYGIFIYEYGRHTYFTNVMIDFSNIPQDVEDVQNISNCKKIYREGGINVHRCIDYWISYVLSNFY